MKKILAILSVIVLMFNITGCSSKNNSTTNSSTTSQLSKKTENSSLKSTSPLEKYFKEVKSFKSNIQINEEDKTSDKKRLILQDGIFYDYFNSQLLYITGGGDISNLKFTIVDLLNNNLTTINQTGYHNTIEGKNKYGEALVSYYFDLLDDQGKSYTMEDGVNMYQTGVVLANLGFIKLNPTDENTINTVTYNDNETPLKISTSLKHNDYVLQTDWFVDDILSLKDTSTGDKVTFSIKNTDVTCSDEGILYSCSSNVYYGEKLVDKNVKLNLTIGKDITKMGFVQLSFEDFNDKMNTIEFEPFRPIESANNKINTEISNAAAEKAMQVRENNGIYSEISVDVLDQKEREKQKELEAPDVTTIEELFDFLKGDYFNKNESLLSINPNKKYMEITHAPENETTTIFIKELQDFYDFGDGHIVCDVLAHIKWNIHNEGTHVLQINYYVKEKEISIPSLASCDSFILIQPNNTTEIIDSENNTNSSNNYSNSQYTDDTSEIIYTLKTEEYIGKYDTYTVDSIKYRRYELNKDLEISNNNIFKAQNSIYTDSKNNLILDKQLIRKLELIRLANELKDSPKDRVEAIDQYRKAVKDYDALKFYHNLAGQGIYIYADLYYNSVRGIESKIEQLYKLANNTADLYYAEILGKGVEAYIKDEKKMINTIKSMVGLKTQTYGELANLYLKEGYYYFDSAKAMVDGRIKEAPLNDYNNAKVFLSYIDKGNQYALPGFQVVYELNESGVLDAKWYDGVVEMAKGFWERLESTIVTKILGKTISDESVFIIEGMPPMNISNALKAELDLATKSIDVIKDEVKQGSKIEKLKEMSNIQMLKDYVDNPPFSILNSDKIGDRPYKLNIDLKNHLENSENF